MQEFTSPTAAQKVWNHYRLLREETYTTRQCRKMCCEKFNLTERQLDDKLASAKMQNKREYARKAQYHAKRRKTVVQSQQCENVPTRCQLLADMEELADLPRSEAIVLLGRYYGLQPKSINARLGFNAEKSGRPVDVDPKQVSLLMAEVRAANGLSPREYSGGLYWESNA